MASMATAPRSVLSSNTGSSNSNANPSTASSSISYEKFAPRSTAQTARLSRIAALTAGPSAVANNENDRNNSSSFLNNNKKLDDDFWIDAVYPIVGNSIVINPKSNTTTVEGCSGSSTNISSNDVVQETLQQTNEVIQQLTQQLKHTTSLRLALRASINIAEDISNRHSELIRHSGELSAAADRLQEEEGVLTRHAADIGMPLQHYDAVDRISLTVGVLFKGKVTVRGLAKTKVDNDDFPLVLDDIDKAITYFSNECGGIQALKQYEEDNNKKSKSNKGSTSQVQQNQQQQHSGSVEYYRRAIALQEAALDLIKEAVAERITTTTTQIIAALNASSKSKQRKGGNNNSSSSSSSRSSGFVVQADQLEASLIYTRFHGISARSNRLLSLVRTRLNNIQQQQQKPTNSNTTSTTTSAGDNVDAYNELLHHCRTTYCTARESLLRQTVRSHMEQLKEQHGPVGMTRLASVFLIRLCTIETSLYIDFFGDKKEILIDDNSSSKTKETTNNSNNRTGFTSSSGSRTMGVVSDTSNSSTTSIRKDAEYQAYLTSLCSELHSTVRRSLVTMTDLDLLCQIVSVLREERSMASTSSFTTLPAARAISSVIQDAQERLIFIATSSLTNDVIKFKPTSDDLNYPDKLIKKIKDPTIPSDGGDDDDAVAKQLQEIYDSWFPPMRSVLRILSKIFRVVEARVFEDMALQSVQSCTRCLKDAAKYIYSHKGQMHSDLFLVKHLLILREQLSPFDIELRSVERQLDFSDAGKAVARFLANRNRRLFSMSTENALVTLLREGVSVQESSVDSKRDLEDALRTACNDFIEHTAAMVAADVVALSELYKQSDAMTLGQHTAKIQADYVLNIVTKTSESLPQTLSEITNQMSLYLDNPATQNILLKPVSRKILRAIEDIRKVIEQISSSTDNTNGWDDEKTTQFTTTIKTLETDVKVSTRVGK